MKIKQVVILIFFWTCIYLSSKMNSKFIVLFAFLFAVLATVNAVNSNAVTMMFNDHKVLASDLTATSFTCTPGPNSAQCDYHGTCKVDGTGCMCDSEYATHNSDIIQCNYKRKSTLLVFLLQFFLGIPTGVGYFILGLNGLGAGQLVLFWLGLIPVCVLGCAMAGGGGGSGGAAGICLSTCYILCWLVGILAWEIYFLVMIGTGKQEDSNNVPLAGF